MRLNSIGLHISRCGVSTYNRRYASLYRTITDGGLEYIVTPSGHIRLTAPTGCIIGDIMCLLIFNTGNLENKVLHIKTLQGVLNSVSMKSL